MTGLSPDARSVVRPQRRAVPTADVRLILAVAVAGSVAAVLAGSALWLSTAGVVALLVFAIRWGPASQEGAGPQLWILPWSLQHEVRTTLTELPEGDAKRLLNEVTRQAAVLFSRPAPARAEAWERDARRNVSELVESACDLAREMARLDRAFPAGTPSSEDDEVVAATWASRRLFAGRLEDAASALAAMYAAGVAHGTPASDRVAELVNEIRADAAATSHARAEVQKLLGT